MTHEGVTAARRLVETVGDLVGRLTTEEWARPSGCAGWRVQDVLAHLSAGAHQTVEPDSAPPPPPGLTAEQQMDLMVAARRDWTGEQVAAEYLAYAARAVDVMASLQDATDPVPLLDLGRYPLSILADVVAFDHYCHLYVDILAPHGPIERSVPPAGDEILRPAIGWMLAGLPQMQGHELDVLRVPVTLELTGPGGGRWSLTPATASSPIVVGPAEGPSATTVRSSASDFVRWATRRAPWRELVQIDGDPTDVEAFLDRVNII